MKNGVADNSAKKQQTKCAKFLPKDAVSARDASAKHDEERKAEPYGKKHGETRSLLLERVDTNVLTVEE